MRRRSWFWVGVHWITLLNAETGGGVGVKVGAGRLVVKERSEAKT